MNFNYNKQLLADTKAQTVIHEQAILHCTPIYRNPESKDSLDKYIVTDGKPIKHISQLFDTGSKNHGKRDCFGYRTAAGFGWFTYDQVKNKVTKVSNGIKKLDLSEQNIGVFSVNCCEWSVSMLSIWKTNNILVPIYATFGDDALKHIFKQTKISLMFCEVSKLQTLFKSIEKLGKNENTIKNVIYYDNGDEKLDDYSSEIAEKFEINLIPFTKFGDENANYTIVTNINDTDKLAIIMYTSGTTGLPKGVMLTHSNVCASVGGVCLFFKNNKVIKSNEIGFVNDEYYLSYLPLAHIFELMAQNFILYNGGHIGFFNGNVKLVVKDFEILQPTIIIGVPRVYQKVYDKVMSTVNNSSGVKKWLLKRSLKKAAIGSRNGSTIFGLYKKILKKIAIKIGWHKANIIISGAAPLPGYLAEFLRSVCDCPVMQGYGMTETAAVASFSNPLDVNVGHVGIPSYTSEIKLRDCPELNYLTSDKPCARGEILVRGPSIFKGYYLNENATGKTLINEGWCCTGDVGRINPNGTLTIIDRVKNIFKLSQGEYVAVEKIESVYSKLNCINQVWIYGNSFKQFIIGVVCIDVSWLFNYGKHWIPTGETPDVNDVDKCIKAYKDILSDKNHYNHIREAVVGQMIDEGKKQGLKGFEQVRGIIIDPVIGNLYTAFNVEANTMTPSMKLKRPQLLQKYIDQIKDLYTELGSPPNANEIWIK